MAAGAVTSIKVKGLKETIQAFNRMDRELTKDLTNELIEAADPVRKLATEYVVAGGGGFDAMQGVVGQWDYVKEFRIGVSARLGEVWIAPAWRRDGSRPQLKAPLLRRLDKAKEDKADEVEKRLGDFLDVLADHWGSHLAA